MNIYLAAITKYVNLHLHSFSTPLTAFFYKINNTPVSRHLTHTGAVRYYVFSYRECSNVYLHSTWPYKTTFAIFNARQLGMASSKDVGSQLRSHAVQSSRFPSSSILLLSNLASISVICQWLVWLHIETEAILGQVGPVAPNQPATSEPVIIMSFSR